VAPKGPLTVRWYVISCSSLIMALLDRANFRMDKPDGPVAGVLVSGLAPASETCHKTRLPQRSKLSERRQLLDHLA
jgi:hypothetical protein